MCAVAAAQAHNTSAPRRTTKYVGSTISGQARQNVSSDTKRVSPAPRRANANAMLTASANEKIATHTRSFGTIALTSANEFVSSSFAKIDTSVSGNNR